MSTPARSRAQRLLSRRCINCSILLSPNMRRYTVEELNEQMTVLLRTWTMPTPVALDDILCIECYLLLQERILSNITGSHEYMSPAYGHLNVCYGCGISIASRRTHRVEVDCPQRRVILKWTLAHLVTHLERVCIPCWLAATREIRQLEVQDTSRLDSVMEAASPSLEDTEIPEPIVEENVNVNFMKIPCSLMMGTKLKCFVRNATRKYRTLPKEYRRIK